MSKSNDVFECINTRVSEELQGIYKAYNVVSNMKSNSCNEDGWDLYEEQTRQEFEYYAVRRGYSVVRDSDYSFFYAEQRTADAWEMYHQGHVRGRSWEQ